MPADARAGPKRLGHLGLVLEHRRNDFEAAGHEGGAVFVGEHRSLLVVEREPAAGVGVVDVASRRLGREPFSQVALVEAGHDRQFRRGRGASRLQRFVEAEPVAQHHQGGAHGRPHVAGHLTHEGLKPCLIRRHIGLPCARPSEPRSLSGIEHQGVRVSSREARVTSSKLMAGKSVEDRFALSWASQLSGKMPGAGRPRSNIGLALFAPLPAPYP